MSQALNNTFMTGEVAGPCELKTSKAGKAYASFKFISKRMVRDTAEETEINCMAFGGLAELIARYLRAPLFISGRLKTERWDYQGKSYSKLVMHLDDAHLLAAESQNTPIADTPPAPVTDNPPVAVADEPPF